MRYKVGDKVIITNEDRHKEWLNKVGSTLIIEDVDLDKGQYLVEKDHQTWCFYDFDIDHEKTAQLSSNTQDIKQDDNVVCMTEEEILGDNVNHPKHYTQGEIETIDKIKYLTEDFNGIEAVCIGNFIKYIDRCNLKGGMEDLEKAKWYLDRFLDEFYDDIMG